MCEANLLSDGVASDQVLDLNMNEVRPMNLALYRRNLTWLSQIILSYKFKFSIIFSGQKSQVASESPS